jgi:hypothetical protein
MDNQEVIKNGQSRGNQEWTIKTKSRMDNQEVIKNGQSRGNQK